LTIDIPDELARQLGPKRERLAEIIKLGLNELGTPENGLSNCLLATDVSEFLARGPQPEEIVAFRPSAKSVARIRELLDRNRQGTLTAEEKSEMDHIAMVNNLFGLIKVQARQHLRANS